MVCISNLHMRTYKTLYLKVQSHLEVMCVCQHEIHGIYRWNFSKLGKL